MSPSFYAVREGRNPGIYLSWAEAREQVHQFPGAKHKRFDRLADAEAFMRGEHVATPGKPFAPAEPSDLAWLAPANPTLRRKKPPTGSTRAPVIIPPAPDPRPRASAGVSKPAPTPDDAADAPAPRPGRDLSTTTHKIR